MLKAWKERFLALSIIIVFSLFIGYSIDTFLGGEENPEAYNRNLFIIASISGLIAIVVGGYFVNNESVGSGLIGGGVITILYGLIRYWEYAENILRVVILALILGVLIWVGIKKFSK